MKIAVPLLTLLLLGPAGFALAYESTVSREEAAMVDHLRDVTGKIYYLQCGNRSTQLQSCLGVPHLWEEKNGLPGLQTTKVFIHGVWVKPDAPV